MEKHQTKTKVLFVITKSNWGGAQKYVYDLATGLSRDNFEVVVALGGTGVLSNKLRTAGVRVISLPALERDINPLKDFSSFIGLWRIFHAERPDVVHLNSAKASGLGALAGRLAGVPKIIFTSHGWAFNEERSWFSRHIIKLISWATVMLAHKTIAVSEIVRQDTRVWPFIADKVVVIRNGIGNIEFLSRDNARRNLCARANIILSEDIFLLGTIGELHPNKGLIYAIEAMTKLALAHPNLYYIVLGDGEEKERLSALIKARGLSERVFLIKEENASPYLKAFDCFMVPSVKEGLPYVVLEAGMASLPVIATSVGGIPEIIENMDTGILVQPRDPQELKNAIAFIISSKAEQNVALGASLYTKVTRDFPLEHTLFETAKLYSDTNIGITAKFFE